MPEQAWFEYHCFESDQSSDAALWHRSHERVVVLGHVGPGGHDPCMRDVMTVNERGDEGYPCMFRVRFDGGWEYDVFEDEILVTRAEFTRPDPPNA